MIQGRRVWPSLLLISCAGRLNQEQLKPIFYTSILYPSIFKRVTKTQAGVWHYILLMVLIPFRVLKGDMSRPFGAPAARLNPPR